MSTFISHEIVQGEENSQIQQKFLHIPYLLECNGHLSWQITSRKLGCVLDLIANLKNTVDHAVVCPR
jgi:hypothetical protein